ncbi:hypothetical protein Tco_0788420 [Tanacetum coccineum]
MKELGEATYILGIKIIHDRSKRLIALSQSAYLEKILKKFRMENSKKGYTLMMEKPDYRKSQGAKIPTEQNLGEIHWTAVKTILKYLRNTKDMVLVYGGPNLKQSLKVDHVMLMQFFRRVGRYKNLNRDMFCTNVEPLDWKEVSSKALPDCILQAVAYEDAMSDNEPALAIASNPEILKGARHFQRKYHYISEVIQEVKIEFVPPLEWELDTYWGPR